MNSPNLALMMLPSLVIGALSFALMGYIALQLRRIAIALEAANRIPTLPPQTREQKPREAL